MLNVYFGSGGGIFDYMGSALMAGGKREVIGAAVALSEIVGSNGNRIFRSSYATILDNEGGNGKYNELSVHADLGDGLDLTRQEICVD